MPRYWFRQRKFGYGAAPNTWQGWIFMRFSCLAVFAVILSAPAIRDNLLRAAWVRAGTVDDRAGDGDGQPDEDRRRLALAQWPRLNQALI